MTKTILTGSLPVHLKALRCPPAATQCFAGLVTVRCHPPVAQLLDMPSFRIDNAGNLWARPETSD
jgi:hypothetical protein